MSLVRNMRFVVCLRGKSGYKCAECGAELEVGPTEERLIREGYVPICIDCFLDRMLP